MRDALPHLFEHSPDLLYQLVTLVSPAQLKVPSHCSVVNSSVTSMEDEQGLEVH